MVCFLLHKTEGSVIKTSQWLWEQRVRVRGLTEGSHCLDGGGRRESAVDVRAARGAVI